MGMVCHGLGQGILVQQGKLIGMGIAQYQYFSVDFLSAQFHALADTGYTEGADAQSA